MNVSIINKTGLVRDTQVLVDSTPMTGVISISLDNLNDRSSVVTATIVTYISKLDVVAEAEIEDVNN